MRHRRYVQHHTTRNRTLWMQLNRKRGREVLVFFVLAVLVAVPLLLYIGFRVERMRLLTAIDKIQRETLTLREKNRMLRVEKARLESLNRVEATAHAELHMVDSTAQNVTLVFSENELRRAELAGHGARVLPEEKTQP
ncbi:MAG: cell division protein FtsL [Acidobacteriota bacterium]|nr:MAG: cell division protein FtsL [Acidobacteriota bacterium]